LDGVRDSEDVEVEFWRVAAAAADWSVGLAVGGTGEARWGGGGGERDSD
jgi:hypothetical protein